MSQRTYHDPLHRGIGLDRQAPAEGMVMDLVDTAPFQRLRRIRQLGPAYLTFHSAESSRFTHSLGVFHLARRAFERMLPLAPELETYRGCSTELLCSMTLAMAPSATPAKRCLACTMKRGQRG